MTPVDGPLALFLVLLAVWLLLLVTGLLEHIADRYDDRPPTGKGF